MLLAGLLSGCQCVQPPADVLFRCEADLTCPQGSLCLDGYCRPLVTSDSGFPCESPPDAGFLFQANVCTPGGFCWQHPLPVGSELFDVRGTSTGEVFFSGSSGLVMKFDGTTFSGVRMPPTALEDVRALWGRGDATLYALAGGMVLYYPGDTEFTVFTNYLGETSLSLEGWEDVRLWAGSTNGSIWELNLINPSWQRTFATGGGVWMHDLWAKSATEVWAAGELSVVAVRHQVGPGQWEQLGGPVFDDAGRPELFALTPLGDELLVGGVQGFLGRVSVERDGGSFVSLVATEERGRSLTAATIQDFWQGPGGSVWSVGNNGTTARRATDGTWSTFDIPDSGTLYAAWGTLDDEPWAVGTSGHLKRRACDAWQTVDYRASTRRLNGVFHNAQAAWAVGEFGTVLRRVNGRWEAAALGRFPVTTTLRDVWGSSDDDVVVAGDDSILATFDGTAWKAVNPAGTLPSRWHRVAARDPSDVWALGSSGSIIRRRDGGWGAVERIPEANNATLNGIAFGDAGEVWIAGDSNVRVLHTLDDGVSWNREENNLPGVYPGSIALTTDGTVWLGGNGQEVYRLPPGTGSWQAVTLPNGNFKQPWNLCALPGNRVTITGSQGLMATATDLGGEVQASTFNRDFEDIDCDPVAGIITVGENGAILVRPP